MTKPSDVVEVRYSKIHNDNVDKDIKVACLSDVHISRKTTKEDIAFIIYTIKKENPDYIFLLGDILDSYHLIDESKTRSMVTSLLVKLSDISKVFFIVGNHDYIYYNEEFKYKNGDIERWDYYDIYNNIHFLKNEIIEEENLVIGGYNEPYNIYHNKEEDAFKKEFIENDLDKVKSDKPKILLTHSPEPLEKKDNLELVKDYNIIMCGHYHNGCVPSFLNKVWIPRHGGVITSSKRLFPNNVRGIKKIKTGQYLFYNGGWIKIADSSPKFLQPLDRICNRQIDISTITNDEKIKGIKVYTKKYKKNKGEFND